MSLLENLFSQSTIERWGWMLVHVLWQATVVAVLLAVALRVLRKTGANLRYLIACSALALMVALPIVTLQLIEVPGPVAEAGPPLVSPLPTTTPTVQTTVEIVEEIRAIPQVSSPPAAMDVTVRVPLQERIVSTLEPALPYIVLGWLAGVFGLSAWHLGGWGQLQRLKRRMVRQIGNPLRQRLEELAAQLGVDRAVGLLESALVEVPTVVGWLRPVILLPARALTGLSTEQLEAILAHELAHIRRYDYFVNILQTIVEILGFYHPAVWWVSRRIRIERENCCDDLAVHICGNSLQYARALTCMEEIRHSRTNLALAATGGSLMSRIARLLGRPAVDDRRFAWLPGLIALLFLAATIIPAALVLATPDAMPVSPSGGEVDVEAEKTTDAQPSHEPKTVRIDVVVAEVFSDATLDPATAQRIGSLLSSSPDSLQGQPLTSIFRQHVIEPNLAGEVLAQLTDLLATQGYGERLVTTVVSLKEGKPAVLHARHPIDPNVFERTDKTKRLDFALTITPRIQVDANTVALDTHFDFRSPTQVHSESGVWAWVNGMSLRVTRTARHGSYLGYPLPIEREDEQGRKRTLLLLLRPNIVRPSRNNNTAPLHVRAGAMSDDPSPDQAARIRVDSRIVKVLSNLRPDQETLLLMANILGAESRLAQEVGRPGRMPNLPLSEILKRYVVQQPLSDETGRAIIDLLQSRGYLKVLFAPRVLAADGKKAEMKIINEEWFIPQNSDGPASSSTSIEKIEFGTVVSVLPRVVDSDRVTLEMMVELTDAVPGPQDSNWPIVSRTSAETRVTAPNDRHLIWAAIELPSDPKWEGKGRESVYVMVRPHIVGPGEERGLSVPGTTGRAQISDEQRVQMRRDQVNSDPMVVELTKHIVELERDLIESRQTLAENHPTIVQKKALLEAFQKRLEEKRTELEQEFDKGLAQRLAADAQAQARWEAAGRANLSDEQRVKMRKEYVDSDPMVAELTKNVVELERDLIESRRKLAENHPTIVQKKTLLETFQKRLEEKRTELEQEFDKGLAERLAASMKQQVLLDVRTVTIERGGLSNLGVEWAWPTTDPGAGSGRSGRTQKSGGSPDSGRWGVQLGYVRDQATTDSLLAALDVMQQNGQAEISSQQIMTQDGCQSQIKAIREERYSVAVPAGGPSSPSQRQLHKVGTGTIVTMTPHIGDNNDIALEMGVEVGNSLPRDRRGSDLPIVTRRTARNVVVITDGGTVVLGGLMENLTGGPNDKSAREVAILVTAHLVRDISGRSLPAPQTTETAVRLPPASSRPDETREVIITATFDDCDLREVLQHISTLAGVPIIPDPNVAGRVTASFKDAPLEQALQMVLAGKLYVFRRTPRCYLVVAPTTTGNAGR